MRPNSNAGGTIVVYAKAIADRLKIVQYYGHSYVENNPVNDMASINGPGNIEVLLCDELYFSNGETFCDTLENLNCNPIHSTPLKQAQNLSETFNDDDIRRLSLKLSASTTIVPSQNYVINNFTCTLRSKNGVYRVLPNDRRSTFFENDTFVGEILFLVRTKPLDPLYAHFFTNKKRMYVIQIQGKFKTKLIGGLYFGMESSNNKMGIISRNISKAMLAVASRNENYLSYSFEATWDKRMMYVYKELITGVDRFHMTSYADQKPPDITKEFPEPSDVRQQRKKTKIASMISKTTSAVNLQTTYSLTVKGNSLDLCEWSTSGMNPRNLSELIGSNAIRLVAFCCQGNVSNVEKDVSFEARRYFLELELVPSDGSKLAPSADFAAVDTGKINFEDDSDSDLDEIALSYVNNTGNDLGIVSVADRTTPFDNAGVFQHSFSTTEMEQKNIETSCNVVIPTENISLSRVNSVVNPNVDDLSLKGVKDAQKSPPLPNPNSKIDWGSEDMLICPACIEIVDYRL